jgi:hypothetical protein
MGRTMMMGMQLLILRLPTGRIPLHDIPRASPPTSMHGMVVMMVFGTLFLLQRFEVRLVVCPFAWRDVSCAAVSVGVDLGGGAWGVVRGGGVGAVGGGVSGSGAVYHVAVSAATGGYLQRGGGRRLGWF